jgi:hypothetical protein
MYGKLAMTCFEYSLESTQQLSSVLMNFLLGKIDNIFGLEIEETLFVMTV